MNLFLPFHKRQFQIHLMDLAAMLAPTRRPTCPERAKVNNGPSWIDGSGTRESPQEVRDRFPAPHKRPLLKDRLVCRCPICCMTANSARVRIPTSITAMHSLNTYIRGTKEEPLKMTSSSVVLPPSSRPKQSSALTLQNWLLTVNRVHLLDFRLFWAATQVRHASCPAELSLLSIPSGMRRSIEGLKIQAQEEAWRGEGQSGAHVWTGCASLTVVWKPVGQMWLHLLTPDTPLWRHGYSTNMHGYQSNTLLPNFSSTHSSSFHSRHHGFHKSQ